MKIGLGFPPHTLSAQVFSYSVTSMGNLVQLGLGLISCYCVFRELVINGALTWFDLCINIRHQLSHCAFCLDL